MVAFRVEVIFAMTPGGGIGLRGGLPWSLPSDLRHFAEVTKGAGTGIKNAVVMGRRTWESLGKPLVDRMNIVVSKTMHREEGMVLCRSLDDAIEHAKRSGIETLFVIGGVDLIHEGLKHPLCENVHVTVVYSDVLCDRVIDLGILKRGFREVSSGEVMRENGLPFAFTRWSVYTNA